MKKRISPSGKNALLNAFCLVILFFLSNIILVAQDRFNDPREPECTLPGYCWFTHNDEGKITVFWEGTPAEPGITEYEIRYSIKSGSVENIFPVITGTSFEFLGIDNSNPFTLEIRKICYWRDGSTILSDWINIVAKVSQKKTLGSFVCGEAYSFPACTPPYLTSRTWTDLYIGGFPIEVFNCTKSSDEGGNKWNGTGEIPLPFNDTYVKVTWTNMLIDQNGNLCGGGRYRK